MGGSSTAAVARVVAISVFKIVIAGGLSALVFRQLVRQKKLKAADTILKDLSTINTNLLIPLFIFTRCSKGLTADLVLHLWVVLPLVLIFMFTGFLCGVVATRLSSAPRAMWPIMVTITTFSNVIGLPLPLLESIIEGLFGHDAAEAQARGASYLFLCNVVQSVLMWSLAGPMLKDGAPCARPSDTARGSQRMIMLENSTRSDMPVHTEDSSARASSVEQQVGLRASEEESVAEPSSNGKGEVAHRIEAAEGGPPAVAAGLCGRVAAGAWRRALAIRNGINRPAAASLFGILVGVTPLRRVLVEEDAPLRWLTDSLELLGTGGIPLIIFVLGATLSKGGGGAAGAMPRPAIAATLAAKLLVVPSVNIGAVYAMVQSGLIATGADGLLPLTLVIVGASPTAMNISIIATMQGTGHREVAIIMFYQYVIAILTVSLFASVGLLLFLP